MIRNREEVILQLLEKTCTLDKDERYMATSDLCTELSKNHIELGPKLEAQASTAILNQLNDKSNDVQSIAVKCLGILINYVQEEQATQIALKLCDFILNSKSELRDIYTIAMKTTLKEIGESLGPNVSKKICEQLLPALSVETAYTISVKSDILSILTDILSRFGSDVDSEHERMIDLILNQLKSSSILIRKRAIASVSCLGTVLCNSLLSKFIQQLLLWTRETKDLLEKRTVVQTIVALSRSAGHRLGQHMSEFVPLLINYCSDPHNELMQTESGDEMRENCFQALESFFSSWHDEMEPHVDYILHLVLSFIAYDPNYQYAEEQDVDMESVDQDEEFSDQEEEYSADDDSSWKVRRASLRVLHTLISKRYDLLDKLYNCVAKRLIVRLQEREENVLHDVFIVLKDLVSALRMRENAHAESAILDDFRLHVAVILQRSAKQLRKKASIPCKRALLAMLIELAQLESKRLGPHFQILIPELLQLLEEKSSDLKFDVLSLVHALLQSHEPLLFQPYMDALIDCCIASAKKEWYRTVSKALEIVPCLVKVLCACTSDPSKRASALLDAVIPSLETHDTDQEIKEAAIDAAAQIIAMLGTDSLGKGAQPTLMLLAARLKNETTRIHAMKALANIARSEKTIDMNSVLIDTIQTLSLFLRQQSRTLKQTSLQALTDIFCNKGRNLDRTVCNSVALEASVLILDNDLQLARLAISLITTILIVCADSGVEESSIEKILSNCLLLAGNAMLQGLCLKTLEDFFANALRLIQCKGRFMELFAALSTPYENESRQSLSTRAQCVAALCTFSSEAERYTAVNECMKAISGNAMDEKNILALYCVGEIGKRKPLNDFRLQLDTIINCFSSDSEEVKLAAAFALGNIAVGNPEQYLEIVISPLEQENCSNLYLYLYSLRQVLNNTSEPKIKGYCISEVFLNRILKIMAIVGEREEEGIRTMTAECLGKLCVTDSTNRTQQFISASYRSPSTARTRWTAITSLRVAIAAYPSEQALEASILHQLFQNVEPFRATLHDEDLTVRRASLLTVNTLLHHYPQFLYAHLQDPLIPLILETLDVKLERTVDLGPFKHKVDDGLPIRKAAFLCLETLVANKSFQYLDFNFFTNVFAHALEDHEDIQIVSHQIIVKLCDIKPTCLYQVLSQIFIPLEKTLCKKATQDQVGTESERIKDIIRSALRAIDAMHSIPHIASDSKFLNLQNRIQQIPSLKTVYEHLKQERLNDP